MTLVSACLLQVIAAPPFIDTAALLDFIIRFVFNFVIALIIIRWIYYPIHRNKDYFFTYFLFNLIIFLLCYMLKNTQLQIGVAFGLFAVFSILRYRTLNVSVVEMAYLFLVITLAVINAMSNDRVSITEVVVANTLIVAVIFVLEKEWLLKHPLEKVIEYEKIENIRPENHQKLLADLRARTGLNVHRFEIGKIDFTRDTAIIRIYYFEQKAAG